MSQPCACCSFFLRVAERYARDEGRLMDLVIRVSFVASVLEKEEPVEALLPDRSIAFCARTGEG